MPASPGSYALLLGLETETRLQIGRHGDHTFPGGDYVYVGSALGPGGLKARVGRHASAHKQRHWHIDYLLSHACLIGAHGVVGRERLECVWAQVLLRLPSSKVVSPGFGASDCRCTGHLVHFARGMTVGRLRQVLVSDPAGLLVHFGEALTGKADDASDDIAHAMGQYPVLTPHLVSLLQEEDADTLWWTVRALAAGGDREALPALIAALKDPEEAVRCAAALALGELRSPDAAAHLTTLPEDSSGWVRSSASR